MAVMSKRITIPPKADSWVQGTPEIAPAKPVREAPTRSPKPTAIKRLTLDIDKALHRRLKITAARQGTTIADLARTLLQEHFGHGRSTEAHSESSLEEISPD